MQAREREWRKGERERKKERPEVDETTGTKTGGRETNLDGPLGTFTGGHQVKLIL